MKQKKAYGQLLTTVLLVFIGFLMITSIAESEILIEGNNIEISDGDATPSADDNTDFGYDHYNYSAYSPEHEFVITNQGVTDLILTDTPRVTLTGTDFSLTQDAPASIAPGEAAIFKVRFAASAVAVRTGNISIANNDGVKNPYNFTIQGVGYSGPVMVIQGGSPQEDIENGDTTPNTSDLTDFGDVDVVTGGIKQSTFEIENYGAGSLSLSGSPRVQITGSHAGDFMVSLQPGETIASGSNDIFTIRFEPTASGIRTAVVSIDNDDPGNNPYAFTIQGSGTARPVVSTQAADNVGPGSAVLNGSIDDIGFPDPAGHGFVWNDTGMPTIDDNVIDLGATGVTGSFTSTLDELENDTTYYVRAFAANSVDTVYGNEIIFMTTISEGVFRDRKNSSCFIESLFIK